LTKASQTPLLSGLRTGAKHGTRFNAEGPERLLDRKASGPRPILTDTHRQALVAQIDGGPIAAIHGVVRWRLCDLGHWLWQEFRVSVSVQTLSRLKRSRLDGTLPRNPRVNFDKNSSRRTFNAF
jgi:hypothetical protein